MPPVSLDLFSAGWGRDFSLVLLANIFHLQTPSRAQDLIFRAEKALAANGVIVIVDQIIDDTAEGSPQNTFARLFAVSMLATGGGGCYATADYDQWLAAADLRRISLTDTPMHRILLARRA
jgi:hypothetical protein